LHNWHTHLPRTLTGALIALMVMSAPAAEAASGSVVIWKDATAGPAASSPDHLGGVLGAAGMSTRLVSGRELAGALDPATSDARLLVLCYGSRYPAVAGEAILRYLRAGGALLALGGRPLSDPLIPLDGGFVAYSDLDRPLAGTPVAVASFEPTTPAESARTSVDRPEISQMKLITEAGNTALQLLSPDMQSYEYVAVEGPATDDTHPILRFRARGDADTKLLCIEPRETDGSRWKAVVPLTTQWQTYRLHTARFRSYASPERGKPGDYLHPERVKTLHFGYTVSMVGKGPRSVTIDDLAWEPGVSAQALSTVYPIAGEQSTDLDRHFGTDLAPLPGRPLPVLRDIVPLAKGAQLRALAPLAPPSPRGAARGWTAEGLDDDLLTAWATNRGSRLSVPRRALGRSSVLLEATTPDGAAQPAFSLIVHSRGDFTGLRLALSGVEQPDLYPSTNPGAATALVRLVRALMDGALLCVVEPEFTVTPAGAQLGLFAEVVPAPGSTAPVSLQAKVQSLVDGVPTSVLAEGKATAQPQGKGPTRTQVLSMGLDQINPLAYSYTTEVTAGGTGQDGVRSVVNVAATARALADDFVRRQQPDGTFGGVSFIDSRATNMLLAMSKITGEKRYADAALRWGQAMLARQREDGGYRMGYGIFPDGEECFVADGGEIAMGMMRLAMDGPEAERSKFRDSLARYLAFREDFRCPEGGIGVGYCRTDYGVRPSVPLKEIKRIYAPEMNTYTIGCTIGTAAAYAAIFGTAEQQAQAAADVRWLLARSTGIYGSASENLSWAHRCLPDPQLRKEIEDAMREGTVTRLAGSRRPWWLESAGRTALTCFALGYAQRNYAPGAATTAEWARSLNAFCSDTSPTSLWRLMRQEKWIMNDWIYACYASIGLVDALSPNSTLPR
jgi:hypothetical protein